MVGCGRRKGGGTRIRPDHGEVLIARCGSQRGFTLLELLVSMFIMTLMAASIYGVLSLGGRSAAAGERKTEQARRLRMATDLMTRQIRSAVPIALIVDGESQEFYLGEPDRLTFVTASPQLPDSSGLSLVSYWLEDDRLMYSELPRFAVIDAEDIDELTQSLALSTTLLYNVDRLEFAYRRSSDELRGFEDRWDASEMDDLPAVVAVSVTPATPDGPDWQSLIPVFVGVYNEIAGEDDFRGRRKAVTRAPERDPDDDDDDGDDDDDDDFDDEDDDDDDDF